MATTSRDTEAFPRLDEHEIDCVATLGELRQFADGEMLIEAGQKDFSFFLVKSGHVDILDLSSGLAKRVVTHSAGEFTGDVDMLTGRPAVISAVARGDVEVYEVTACRIRGLLGELPELSDKLLAAFQVRRKLLEASNFVGIRVVGASHSKETLAIREFFHKNKVLHTFQDIDEEDGQNALREWEAASEETPIIACSGHVVRQPSLEQVAECLGISRKIPDILHDLVIVGAGPAGLAAAVYGATEGLSTLVVDRMGPGGQAGQSSRIENYMGFPAGLPGAELANRGYLQALKFGARFTAPVSVRSLRSEREREIWLDLCTGQTVRTRAVLIATGVSYRRLPVENCQRLEGAGIYYSATAVEARHCRDQTAIVVGGGNSAGQAAMFLAQQAREVKILLRGGDLRKSMSHYLCRRIEMTSNIDVLCHTEVAALEGEDRLRDVRLQNNQTGEFKELGCSGLFIFIGAKPHTEWLPPSVALDAKEFVLTGPALKERGHWNADRPPCELETSHPGVFAAGDVRAGTTKRCAFAAGDGALAVTCVHQYLG